MFSKRTNWSLEANQISALKERLCREGRGIIDLCVSNPTVCGFSSLEKAAGISWQSPQNQTYDPQAQGLLSAREVIAGYYHDQGRNVSLEQIFLTASTSEAYSYLFRLLTDPGDTVLVPRPSYPLFDFLTGLNDLTARDYHLVQRDGWAVTAECLSAKAAPQPKVLLVVNPNNPTGSYLSAQEQEILNAFCVENQTALISDEVFFDYVLDEKTKRTSFVENHDVLTFVLNGLSKTLALPQMKLSWIVVNGPCKLVEEAKQRLEVIADTYLSVGTPVQNALHDLFALREDIQGEIRGRMKDNLQFLREACRKNRKASCLPVGGGWSAVLQLPEHLEEEQFVLDLLEKDGVFVHPGYFFDFEQQPLVVVSLLPQQELFQEGLSRLLNRI